MSLLFGSLFALALALVTAQSTTDIDSNSTTTTTTATTAATTIPREMSVGGVTDEREHEGFIVDATSWGDYNGRLEERLNADGVDLLKHADEHTVRLSLKAGPQGTYYLVNVNEFSGKFDVAFRLVHSRGPTVYDYLKTLDPDGVAYVAMVGSTQALAPPSPLYFSSIRAANWANAASILTFEVLILMVGVFMVA